MFRKEISYEEEKENINTLCKYFEKALNIVKKVIGREEVEYLMEGKNITLDISYELEDWAGRCIDHEYYYEIKIRYDVFYHCKAKNIIEILIHEILHTFCNTCGHDMMWLYYANLVNESTPYTIPIGDWFDEE